MEHKCKVIIFKGFWSVKDVEERKNCLFVYGDNSVHKGKKGQAIIRDCPNTFGIPTKIYPSMTSFSFMNDNDYEKNVKMIDESIQTITQKSENYSFIIFPEDSSGIYTTGLGLGLADLPNKAPKTFKYLNEKINQIIKSL